MKTIILAALAIILAGCMTINVSSPPLPVGGTATYNITQSKDVPVTPSVTATVPAQTLAGALTGGATSALEALVGK